MPKPITQAQPPLEFIPPAYNPLAYQLSSLLLPLWTRWRAKIVEMETVNAETLVDCYRQFEAGEARIMLAFRHPSVNDPLCLFHLLSRTLPAMAWQKGVTLPHPTHAHFMYDRGIPLWAGKTIGWLLKNLGCTPIRRGKLDLLGLRSARQLFLDGQFPLAAAPEGATNGHSEIVSPIEPGIAQLGFWCVEDLQKAKRSETVLLLPIGVQYFYLTEPWDAIEQLLSQLETDCGLPRYTEADTPAEVNLLLQQAQLNDRQSLLYRRLLRLGAHLLVSMEQFYSKFYHRHLRSLTPESSDPLSLNSLLAQRMQALLDAALSVAEDYFGVPAKGNVPDRCRRLEQAGWDWIFREDLKELEALSPVDRGLADRIAEEAALRLWHMRLVESFVSVTGRYVLEKPTVDRFAELLLLLFDTVNKMKGETVNRPRLGKQRAQLTIGEPIDVGSRWADYKSNRRSAVAALTQDLQTALEKMIVS